MPTKTDPTPNGSSPYVSFRSFELEYHENASDAYLEAVTDCSTLNAQPYQCARPLNFEYYLAGPLNNVLSLYRITDGFGKKEQFSYTLSVDTINEGYRVYKSSGTWDGTISDVRSDVALEELVWSKIDKLGNRTIYEYYGSVIGNHNPGIHTGFNRITKTDEASGLKTVSYFAPGEGQLTKVQVRDGSGKTLSQTDYKYKFLQKRTSIRKLNQTVAQNYEYLANGSTKRTSVTVDTFNYSDEGYLLSSKSTYGTNLSTPRNPASLRHVTDPIVTTEVIKSDFVWDKVRWFLFGGTTTTTRSTRGAETIETVDKVELDVIGSRIKARIENIGTDLELRTEIGYNLKGIVSSVK